jgi:excisionase family DNA binding protein
LLSYEQIAARLNLSVTQVKRMRARHQIPFVKMGKTIRFFPEEVEETIRKNLTVRAIPTKKAASKPTSIPKATGANQ